MTKKQWLMVAAVMVYYVFVRWIHAVLEAGPVVLIATALVTIFTIGLNDDEKSDGLSAYSVFNKGFQKIMGSIDEDSLLQQHIGGGVGLGFLAAAAAVGQDRQPPLHNDPAPSHRRPRRRQQQQQQQQNPERLEDDQNNVDPAQQQQQQQQQQEENNRSRKSGKKARRGNLEQRREMQSQREAALAMGFENGENDQMAMNRLLDDDPMPMMAEDFPIQD
jgi:hypothetical protein